MRPGLALAASWLAVGCAYTPPVRGLHAGMPDRVGAGQLEVSGAAGGVYAPATGGPTVSYGVSDSLVLEGGANLNFLDGLWATAFGGARFVTRRGLGVDMLLVADAQLGGGLTLGGRLRLRDEAGWATRPGWGLYQGLGVGLRARWFGLFLRGRLDASAGTVTPPTLWPSAVAGLEAKVGRYVVVSAGGGGGAFWNTSGGWVGFWLYQASVSLLFDVSPRREDAW